MTRLDALPGLIVRQDWAAAERLLRRAAQGQGATAPVFYNLAKVLEAQGKPDQRLHWLRRAVARDPAHPAAWFEIGRALLALPDLAGAEAAYARAALLDPSDAEAWGALWPLRLRLGDWAGARAALATLPDTPATRAARYRIACELGEAPDPAPLLADPAGRPEALKALTRVSRGRMPLRL